MTKLVVIPNVDKKRLAFEGRIASGEHVDLSIYGFYDKVEDGRLRIRAVDFMGNTLAVFPGKMKDDDGNEVMEQWGDEGGDATCTFNLNTIPALKYFRRGGECLIVLDDPESKTLYGSGHLCVLPWPKEIGKDEPVDLDAYPDNIMDFVRRLDAAEGKVENCRQSVASALASVSNANMNANTAVSTAQNALTESSEAKTSADNALADSAAAKKAARDAEGLVSAAQNAAQDAKNSVAGLAEVARSGSYNDLSDKPQIPSINGLAKKTDVDHVENVLRGELNGETSRAMEVEEALKTAVGGKADVTALASERQRAEAAENDLRARIAALKSFDVRVVNALPVTGLPNTVYLVPSAKSADLNVKDEYLWLDGAWEQIGSTAVDLTDYARKSEVPRRPEDIGAANATHTHSRSQITDFPTAMNPTAHADKHAAGGDDAITPASIGALTKGDIASKAEAECDLIWVAYKKMLPTRVTEYVAVVVQSDGDPIVAKYIGKPTVLNIIPLDQGGAATETVGGTVCDLMLRELVGPSGIASYSLEVYDHDTGDQLGSASTTDTPSEVRNAKTVVQSIENRIGGFILDKDKRYEFSSVSPSGNVFQLKDFTVNTISLTEPGTYVLKFPPPVENRVRDFVVKVKVTTSAIPTVTFQESDGMPAPGFEAEDDEWATLELGINYFSFTESER